MAVRVGWNRGDAVAPRPDLQPPRDDDREQLTIERVPVVKVRKVRGAKRSRSR